MDEQHRSLLAGGVSLAMLCVQWVLHHLDMIDHLLQFIVLCLATITGVYGMLTARKAYRR